jgi:hypothetical protein
MLPAALVLAACSAIALGTMEAGLDYFVDASGPIDALVRGDLDGFFRDQAFMGPLSLLVRAPFVRLDFDGDLSTVYYLGVIPCYAVLLVFASWLWSRMGHRPRRERWGIVAVCLASPIVIRAIHWGHPEEVMCAALCVGAVLAASGDRPLLAGLLLGLGYATKQWAVMAGLPALIALPSRHWRFLAVAIGVALLFTLPMFLGDPDRFIDMQRAAGSGDPSSALGVRADHHPPGRTMPQSFWLPFTTSEMVDGSAFRFSSSLVIDLAHPLMLLAGLPLAFLLWRRGPVSRLHALTLLALVFLLRGALETNTIDYYHVPLMTTLAALATFGGIRELRVLLFTGAGLGLAFADPASRLADQADYPWLKWTLYMATVAPLCVWLVRELYFPSGQPSQTSKRVSRTIRLSLRSKVEAQSTRLPSG